MIVKSKIKAIYIVDQKYFSGKELQSVAEQRNTLMIYTLTRWWQKNCSKELVTSNEIASLGSVNLDFH